MGAWSEGNFSNDTALDYLAGITSLDDIMRPIKAVTSVSSGSVDADIACKALAAADLLASMLGRPAPDLPEDAEELILKFGKPPPDMLMTACSAVSRVLDASELADLWNEGESQPWKDVISDLLKRLDTEVDYHPAKRKRPAKGGFICSVCEAIIPDDELIRIEIGFLNMPGITMGRYFHRNCIEANFRPPYFNKQGEVRGSLKRQIKRFLKKKDKAQANI